MSPNIRSGISPNRGFDYYQYFRARPLIVAVRPLARFGNIDGGREMKIISRTFFRGLVRAAFLLLVPLHAATAQAQSLSTQPPFPPPGRLVDIGGWRLHLNCTGEVRASQPTI